MRTAFAERECMVHRSMPWLDPLLAERTMPCVALEDLNQRDGNVAVHLEKRSSVSLAEADLALAVTFTYALQRPVYLAA
jgi:hypothetical protein